MPSGLCRWEEVYPSYTLKMLYIFYQQKSTIHVGKQKPGMDPMGFGDDHLGTPYDSSFLLFQQLCGFSFSPIKRCNATVSHVMCELYNHHVIMHTLSSRRKKNADTNNWNLEIQKLMAGDDFLDSTCRLRRFQD